MAIRDIKFFCVQRSFIQKKAFRRIYRRLPAKGELNVSINDSVVPSDFLGECKISSGFRVFNLAEILDIQPIKVSESMLKIIGAKVFKGEKVAESKKFLGAVSRQFIAPCDGILESLDNRSGRLTIKYLPSTYRLLSGLYGQVSEVVPQEGAFIETKADIVCGLIGSGFDREGTLKVISQAAEVVSPSDIDTTHSGKILAVGSLITRDLIQKAITLGIKGLIAGGINTRDYKDLVGSLNPQEDVGISLLVLTGFGRSQMERSVFELLKNNDGHYIILSPSQKEVIIPLPKKDWEKQTSKTISKGNLKTVKILQKGDMVRILSWPYLGKTAEVKEIKKDPILFDSQIKEVGVEVIVSGKKTVFLPIRNIEIIKK